MKLYRTPLFWIAIVAVIVVGAVLFLISRSGKNDQIAPENLAGSIEDGEILCPLEGDDCAAAEVTQYLDEAIPYSTLFYYQTASESSVVAVFSGDVELDQRENGDKIVRIKNSDLNLEAEYIAKGNVTPDLSSTTKGDQIITIPKAEGIEVLNDALIFNIYRLGTEEKVSFEAVDNMYLRVL